MMPTIKHLRIKTGYRPGAFSKLAGVSYGTYWRIETKGKNSVTPEMFARVMNTLSKELGREISPDEIEDPTQMSQEAE